MASSVGDIAVTVGADIDPLRKGLKDGSRSLGKFKKDLASGAKQAAKYNAALSLVAATGLAVITAETAAVAKETKNLAFLANSSVETFQKMAFAAKSVGVEQDKLSDILKDFNDRVGDFVSTGGGPMADFFEKIAPQVGVTADEFRKLSGPQALQLYYDSLEQANLAQQDMTFFLEAMASDTTALIPLLRDGGRGFREIGDEAERFNMILSSQDIEELAKVDKSFNEIKASISGAAKQIALLVSNEMGSLKDSIIGVVTELGNVVKGIKESRKAARDEAEQQREINSIIGKRIDSRGRLVSVASKEAEEINKLINKQKELQAVIDAPSVSAIGRSGKANAKRQEQRKAEITEEIALNDLRIEQLLKESEAAQKVFNIRSGTLEKEKELSEVPKVEEPSTFIPEDTDAINAAQAKAKAELDSIKNKYLTEQQLLTMHREEMAIIGDSFDASRFDTEKQWMDIKEQAEKTHLDKLDQLRKNSMTKAQKFSAMSWQNQVSTVTSSLAEMTAGVAQHSKKAFKINKIAGIANAIVNTAQGVTKALASYPPPVSFAMAAAQGAAGLAQINAIKSQSFSGGGSGRAPSLTGTAGTPVNDVGGGGAATQQAEPQRILVEGLSQDQLISGRALAEIFNESSENGAIFTLG